MASSSSRREALRRQHEAEERARRTKRITIASVVTVAVVVVVIVAVVLIQALSGAKISEDQQRPPNATAGHGILVGGKQPSDGVPHLVMYGDYLCPACADAESVFGSTILTLVSDGSMTAEVRQAHFKDGAATMGPSKKAAVAAAAADSVGRFDAYHAGLFASQQTGFTDEFLRETLPAQIGMEGEELTRFQALFDEVAFNDFTDEADGSLEAAGVSSTPTYLVGETKLDLATIGATPEEFLAAVRDAA